MFNNIAYQRSVRDDTTFRVSGGGEKELPDVTATDNGKVLTVVNGAWGAVVPNVTQEKYTIAEEQEVTCGSMKGSYMGLIATPTEDAANIAVGDTVYLTIDGVTYSGTVEDDGEHKTVLIPGEEEETGIMISFELEEDPPEIWINDANYLQLVEGNTYTVKMRVETPPVNTNVVLVKYNDSTNRYDKTPADVYTAMTKGIPCYLVREVAGNSWGGYDFLPVISLSTAIVEGQPFQFDLVYMDIARGGQGGNLFEVLTSYVFSTDYNMPFMGGIS